MKKYNLKEIARIKVQKALKIGKLKKENCIVCGNAKSEAHHEDYYKPLKIIWLCSLHHKEKHKRLKGIKTFKTQSGKTYLKERRDNMIWQLNFEGYEIKDIKEIFGGLDRTWIFRIIKQRPDNWVPNNLIYKKKI